MKELHTASDGVLGGFRMWEELSYEGETCSPNRVARLMRANGLRGVPQRRRWGKKPSGSRPDGIANHLQRDFEASQPNAKWVTDITYIRTGEGWLYLCAVVDLHSKEVVGWSMGAHQQRSLVLQAVLTALWQRDSRAPVVLHSDRGTQFTSEEYQRFLADHNLTCSMSAVGSCADNAAAESFFGLLKRDRVQRRRYATRSEARADVFDYIERFHNPRMRRRQERLTREEAALTQPSTKSG
jgi:putative transposase